MKRGIILSLLVVMLLAGIVSLSVSAVYGVSVDDCKAIGIASCEIPGLDTLCDKLFSDPQPCEKLCKSIARDEEVAACIACCKNVKGQLNLDF